MLKGMSASPQCIKTSLRCSGWVYLILYQGMYNKNGVFVGEQLLRLICFSYVSMAQCKTCLFDKLQRVNEQNNDHKTSLDHVLDHVLPCQFVSGHIDVFGYYMVGYYAVGFGALWPFLLFITHEWRIIRIRILIPLIIRCLSRVLKLLYWIDIRMKGGVMCNQMLEKIVFVSSYFLDHYIHKLILACYLKKKKKKSVCLYTMACFGPSHLRGLDLFYY